MDDAKIGSTHKIVLVWTGEDSSERKMQMCKSEFVSSSRRRSAGGLSHTAEWPAGEAQLEPGLR